MSARGGSQSFRTPRASVVLATASIHRAGRSTMADRKLAPASTRWLDAFACQMMLHRPLYHAEPHAVDADRRVRSSISVAPRANKLSGVPNKHCHQKCEQCIQPIGEIDVRAIVLRSPIGQRSIEWWRRRLLGQTEIYVANDAVQFDVR